MKMLLEKQVVKEMKEATVKATEKPAEPTKTPEELEKEKKAKADKLLEEQTKP